MSGLFDSWMEGIGIDVQGIIGSVKESATAVIEKAEGAVTAAAATVTGAAPTPKPAAAPAPKPAAPNGAPSANGSSSVSSLKGSVGAGGTNNPDDVKAVQTALKIGVDGKCGTGTIAAIKAFQKSIGQANPDGRVDAGGATARALGSGGAAPASAPAPTPDATSAPAAASAPAQAPEEEGFFDGLKKKVINKLEEGLDTAKDLGGKVVDGAKDLGGKVVDGAKGLGGTAPDGAPGPGVDVRNDLGGSGSSLGALGSVLGIGVGGQFSFPGIALPPTPGFPVGTVAFGQFAGKLSVKFKPTLLSSIKAPKAAEAEPGIKAICNEIYENASFKWFGGVTLKGDTKSAGVSASFLKVSTKIGEVTLEIKAFEVGLDIKKIVKASFGSTSANYPAFERELNGVKYEIIISLGGALEVSPNPIAGAQAFTSGGILLAIDVALVAGPPLAAAAVIGIGIFMAGEKGKRDEEIIEGAIDARKAAFDYAFTMTGNEGGNPGPRAKAAVAVAKAELAKVAASQKVSLEALMKELALAELKNHDFGRIHAQARQQIFAAYFAEVRNHLKRWRNEHSVLAAFTTEADDFAAVEKKVAVIFEKP